MATAGGPDIIEDGLVLALDAANTKSYPGSGTTWNDLSGNGNNGTLTNGPTFSTDNIGNLVFDGTDDWVATGYSSYSDHTIQGWIKTGRSVFGTAGTNLVTALGNYTAATGAAGKYTLIGPYDTSQFTFRIDDGVNSFSNISTTSYNLNQWYYLTLTYDSSGTAAAYKDGSLLNSIGYASGLTFDSIDFNIGRSTGNGFTYEGSIALVTLYNRALSAQEVLQNYNATKGRFGI